MHVDTVHAAAPSWHQCHSHHPASAAGTAGRAAAGAGQHAAVPSALPWSEPELMLGAASWRAPHAEPLMPT